MISVYDLKGDEKLSMTQKASVVYSTDSKAPYFAEFRKEVIPQDFTEKWILINNRTFGNSMQTRTSKSGHTFQQICEDRNLQIAEDWTVVPMNCCRCCHKEIGQKYDELYFEHRWDFDTLFCYDNGYCQKCAMQKAGIEHKDPDFIKEDYRESKYDVGGESFTFRTFKDGTVTYFKNEKRKNSSSEL